MKTYLVELLMKQDQMSMAASVESRVPFLDHKLVECVNRLPARYKIRGLSGKYLLRKAMASRLPSEVIKGHKRGFPTPVRPWLQNQLFDKVSNILTDGRMAERRLFRSEHLDAVLKAHRAGFSNATDCCWRLLTLELWQRIFLDRDSKALDSHTPHCEAAMCAA
jgi:asparagine synthase (glutamine-hydrolysing)